MDRIFGLFTACLEYFCANLFQLLNNELTNEFWNTCWAIQLQVSTFKCQAARIQKFFKGREVRRKGWGRVDFKKNHYMFIHVISVYTHKIQTNRSFIYLFLSVYFSFFCFSLWIFHYIFFNFQNSKGPHRTPSGSANTGYMHYF